MPVTPVPDPIILEATRRVIGTIAVSGPIVISGTTVVSGLVVVTQDDPANLNATVVQPRHNQLNANANLQVGNENVDQDNPIPITSVQAADCSPNDTAAPANDTIATVTYAAAGAGISHLISGVGWSYNDTPNEQGRIWILDGIETVFDLDVTNAGPGFFTFDPPKRGRANRAMVINLAAAGCAGKLSILGHWTG